MSLRRTASDAARIKASGLFVVIRLYNNHTIWAEHDESHIRVCEYACVYIYILFVFRSRKAYLYILYCDDCI